MGSNLFGPQPGVPPQQPDATAVAPSRWPLAEPANPAPWTIIAQRGREALAQPLIPPQERRPFMESEESARARQEAAFRYTTNAVMGATGAAPEAALSQGAKGALDALGDVVRGTSKDLPKFAILSADREGLLPAVLKDRHEALGQAIKDAGFEPVEHKGGIWVNDAGKRVKERGYIVPGMDAAQARHLGARFGQQAVITNEGYHDVNAGTTAPFTGAGAPEGKEPHTVLPSGKKLALRFDFDKMQQTATPEPGAIAQHEPSVEGGTALPRGAPSVLGASDPKYAYRATGQEPHGGPVLGEGGILSSPLGAPRGTRHGLPLANEDVRVLGVAGRHLLQDSPTKGAWVEAMKKEHPNFAPHLEGWAGDAAYKVAQGATLPPTADFTHIERLARSSEGEATRPWYHEWWPAVRTAFGGEDGEMLTRFHAALSAQASPERNAELSLAALKDYKDGKLDFPSVGTTPERTAALKRLAQAGPAGQQAIAKEGPKVNNFYLALKGHPDAVVLDRHMARAYLGDEYGRANGGKTLSDQQYYALDARVRSDAAKAGVSPRDYQAMVWGGQTKYPFEPPQDFLWKHLVENRPWFGGGEETIPLYQHYPNLGPTVQQYAAKQTMMQDAHPSHAAVKVGDRVFEVPMNRGHAGALEKAIEEMREPGFQPDDIMASAEDGYTRGDGRFIPRSRVDFLHSSDFIRGKKLHPDEYE